MFFGTSLQQVQELNNLISLADGDDVFSGDGLSEFEWDLNDDGFVGSADLLDLLALFGEEYTTADLLGLLTQFNLGDVSQDEATINFENIDDFTAEAFMLLYDGSRKEIHSVYANQLNAPELTGRYMKVDLVSDDEQDDAQL